MARRTKKQVAVKNPPALPAAPDGFESPARVENSMWGDALGTGGGGRGGAKAF